MGFKFSFNSPHWRQSGSMIFAGYATNAIQSLDLEELERLFYDCNSIDECLKVSNTLSGQFSIVLKRCSSTLIITSPGLFFPVYFKNSGANFELSDNVQCLKPIGINKLAYDMFLYSGMVLGNKTIYADVFYNPSGTVTELTQYGGFTSQAYFTYAIHLGALLGDRFVSLKEMALNVIKKSFDRCIAALDGQMAVVPLSGGYDSRLILAALVKAGYPNITTFTYGVPNNPEAKIAKVVADRLGIRWINIEYTDDFIEMLYDKPQLEDYIEYANGGKSGVCLHEFFAVKYMKDNHLIPSNSVFLPGHSGDLLGGSQLFKVVPTDLAFNQISKLYVSKKFSQRRPNAFLYQEFTNYLETEILTTYDPTLLPYSIFEDIDLKERISKFILNASQVFKYFNYRTLTPFWDKDLTDFFKMVPLEWKLGKRLYDETLEEFYFKPLGISFDSEMNPTLSQIKFSKIKKRIKKFLPSFIKQRILVKNDFTNYNFITKPLLDDLKQGNFPIWLSGNDYNEIINQWILFNAKKVK